MTTGPSRDWEPDRYNRFTTEREQPCRDLAGLIVRDGRPVVVDLGCGDGRLTADLHRFLGATSTTGIDRSAAMVEAAAARAGDGLSFRRGDIAHWADGVDVVTANASLQWVPDHRAVLGRWAASLRPGGQLAVLAPDRWEPFVERYRRRLVSEVGRHSPYLYPFTRILMWGRRP